uniref:SAM domain-containing protein n=1 Tax=Steinernema glaseri TaxID=37863 RepID=A0A1I7YSM7_9BILA
MTTSIMTSTRGKSIYCWKAQRSASLTKSIFFDTPLTPFEERMQSQAHALRKTNIRLDDSSDTSVDVTMQLPQNKRHSASEVGDNQKMTLCGVAQTFTNAAALAQQPRHERYAAHIPIHRSASSTVASSSGGGGQDGRQSTTSMESANSAILDTASKQLDQMIDQARYRHHQHRSKFKEAIDYLDQIFEDLKRECDHSNEPQKVAQKGQQAQPQPQPQQQQAQKIVQQQKNREPPQQRAAPARRNPQPYQQRFLQEHQPQPVVYTHPIKPAPKQNGNAFTANAEVEVSETIVLPPKKVNSEKMDFTRKWLDGDTKMWTGSEPKPDLILGRDDQCESDERSIGSCSAEVAAINASDRQKKQRMRETPDLIQNVTNGGQKRRKQPQSQQHHLHQQQQQPQQQLPAPVRPQPCRPQPTYAIPTTSSLSGSSGQLNITPYSSFSACHPIKRVPSQDQFSHYGSLHSEDRYQPDKSGSAFLQYKQQNTRGSIQSLPDAGLMKIRKPDLMSIDALVAELELNTDEQGNGSRRSFPVNEEGNRPQPKFNTNIDYEEPKHMKMNRLGHLNGHVMNGSGNHTQVGSVDRGMRRLRQRQQENLDDVTHHMLNNAATDFGASTAGSRPRPYHRAPPSAGTGLTPFETINTERLNPSKVNAIQSMFEAKKSEAPTSHPPPQWRRNVVHPNANPQQVPKEEDTYYEINEFCTRGDRKGSLKQQSKAATSKTGQETGPLYPLTQPPAYPPGGNSSTNSSHHGYYSSSSPPSAAPNRHSRQGSFQGSVGGTEGRKHSMVSSRATSFDEEDDGFYDNIVTTADNRRHSRISDMDNTSLMSHRLPPASAAPQQQSKSGRFGQFLQKIGGPWSRPPTSASSLMSLNKMSVDGAAKRGGGGQLMKSNSLSNEPWNSQIISASRSSTPDQKRNGSSNHGSVGLGQRLKSSFFGSRKRLN